MLLFGDSSAPVTVPGPAQTGRPPAPPPFINPAVLLRVPTPTYTSLSASSSEQGNIDANERSRISVASVSQVGRMDVLDLELRAGVEEVNARGSSESDPASLPRDLLLDPALLGGCALLGPDSSSESSITITSRPRLWGVKSLGALGFFALNWGLGRGDEAWISARALLRAGELATTLVSSVNLSRDGFADNFSRDVFDEEEAA